MSTLSLQEEFRRLSLTLLVTIEEDMTNFISVQRGLSLFSLNCQSLSAHDVDFTDTITQRSNILLLSETWLKNEDSFDILDFDCVCHFKRSHVRTGGVALYQNFNDVTHVITPHRDLMMRQTASLAVNASEIGEICAARYTMEKGQTVLLACIYISPGSSVAAHITFIHILVLYTPEVSATTGSDDKKPIILTGVKLIFNVNFASEEANPLIEFLKRTLNLTINTDSREGTTRYGTTIDAVFLIDLNRKFSYLTSVTTNLLFLSWKMMM
ncbi:ATP-dependent DNA helicase [Trichonephila clavipes]|nr:ATP-dependent DNA helicase [Trichonephila clavipes]